MRKGRDRGEMEEKMGEKKKIKTFLVATNVVASRPPERRPTGTATARANFEVNFALAITFKLMHIFQFRFHWGSTFFLLFT